MKVIFLDIDGVLNAGETMHRRELDTRAIAALVAIVQRSGAKIVISSTWRLHHRIDELKALLAQRGFTGEVIGTTPRLSRRWDLGDTTAGRQRAREIRAWLDEHPEVEAFAILDDEPDLAPLQDHQVQTDPRHGLRLEHVAEASALLEMK
jgi:hypothetical protein